MDTIWELCPEPICILDKILKIKSVNAAFSNWVHRSPSELEGLSLKLFTQKEQNIFWPISYPDEKAVLLKKTTLSQGETVMFFSLGHSPQKVNREIENLSLVAQYTTNSVIITNKSGYTEWINQGCELMTGYRLADFLGKKPGQLLQGPLTDKNTVDSIRKQLKHQSAFKEVILNYNIDGSTYWVELNISPIFSQTGQLVRFIAVQNNITEFVEREQEFERLAVVAQKTSASVIITDKNDVVEWINEGCRNLTGYSLEDFKNKTPAQVLQGKDSDPFTARRIQANLAAQISFSEKILIYRADGTTCWTESNVSPIFDKMGELKGYIRIERNIDEEIKQSLIFENLSYVARFVTNSVIIANPDGYTEWINDACTKISGYTLADFKGKKPGQVLQGPLTNPETRKRIAQGLKERVPVKEEIINYHRNGTPYWIELNINPVFDKDGKFLKFVSVQIDIDERVKRERALADSVEQISQSNEELQQMTEELRSAFDAANTSKQQAEEFLAYQNAIYNSVDASIITFSNDGEISQTNKITQNWLGYDADEMVGLAFPHLPYLLIEETNAIEQELIKHFGIGLDKVVDNISNLHYMQVLSEGIQTYRRKDGSTFPVRAYFCPIKNIHEEVLGYLTIAYDISKTKKLEEQVRIQNKRLTDSINYAQRIQLGIIPRAGSYEGLIKEGFVINLPKDVVSGDFYWSKKLSDSMFLAICVDCTGHGVPGAMMSMLSVALLNSIVNIEKCYRPSEILQRLDNLVQNTLGQDSQIPDGMDVAVCLIDVANKKMEFSGALRPVWIVDERGLTVVEGSKFWIGGTFDKRAKVFDTQTIDLLDNIMIYLFSDGMQSQFGGENDKKFGVDRLKRKLEKIYSLPCEEQKKQLTEDWQTYKSNKAQTDDILVVGFRV